MDLEVVEVAISAVVTLAAIMAGTVVVTAGEVAVHLAAGIGVVESHYHLTSSRPCKHAKRNRFSCGPVEAV